MIGHPVTLGQALQATVQQRNLAEAFVAPGERRTWQQLWHEADAVARALHASGVAPGDHIGVLLGNGARWLSAFFGCAMVGAVTVPVNTRFKADELAWCLRQADVSRLIMADRFLDIDFLSMLAGVEPALQQGLPGSALPGLREVVVVPADGEPALPPGAVGLSSFLARGEAVGDAAIADRRQAVSPDDVLLIQYTSGTTSFPKGVMLTHANMVTDAWAVAQRIGVRAEDRYFSIRPYFHVAGTTLSILVSVVSGCCLLTLPRFDVAQALQMLDDERCTLTSGNDTIFLMLMGHPEFRRERLHLRGGWAAAGVEVMTRIRDEMGVHAMCNAYGQSEASPNVTMTARDDPFELRAAGWSHPHPGTEVRVVDPDTGERCPPLARGEIQVRGWNVMKGYYNLPEATAKAFTPDGWLRTGDLGEQDDQGRIRMVGRLKDMLRVGGENVAPAEVEEVLLSHPAITLAQVVGVPDARLGEVVAAFVVPREGQSLDTDALHAWCRERMANFKVPRFLAVVDSFESIGMTGSSKVQKNKLRAHALQRFGLTEGQT